MSQSHYPPVYRDKQHPKYPMPPNYMVLAIFVTVLCCLPFGLVSIYYANRVDTLWLAGEQLEAESCSRKARNWAISGVIFEIVFVFIYFIKIVALGAIFSGLLW